MNVVVGSAHRNSAHRVPVYVRQVSILRDLLASEGNSLRVVAVEGDSVDDRTRNTLIVCARHHALPLQIVEHHHGGPEFGSIESMERMRALSGVGNAIFDAVRLEDDVLVYVESDLYWDARSILTLIEYARDSASSFHVFSPMVMAGRAFYDIWAFRDLDGNRFSPLPPYHPNLNGALMEVGSVGSCLVMRGDVARQVRIRDENCLVGWSAEARRQGYRIAVDPSLMVSQI